MTDFNPLLVADRGQKAHPIHLVDKNSFEDWAKTRPAEDRALLKAHRFDAKTGFAFVILPRKADELEVVQLAEVTTPTRLRKDAPQARWVDPSPPTSPEDVPGVLHHGAESRREALGRVAAVDLHRSARRSGQRRCHRRW